MAEHRRSSDSAVEGQVSVEGVRVPRGERHEHKHLFSGLRQSDIEPYTGLGYLSKLFKFMAIVLMLLLVAEVITGIFTQGAASIPVLLGEASRLIVLAGVLWGSGDLALLLVDIGHDVRANRILMSRIAHQVTGATPTGPGGARPSVVTPETHAETPLSARPVDDRLRSSGGEGGKAPPIP